MQIIAGKSRGIFLDVMPGLAVRPTAGRSRKALFDSLGDFTDARVVDLFAGSGALGLESASRGAASVLLVELQSSHLRIIESNVRKVLKTGVETNIEILRADALQVGRFIPFCPEPDLIFADPPYPESADFFQKLVSSEAFLRWAAGAQLVWEIPDTKGAAGHFINRSEFECSTLRKFGATTFFLGTLKNSKEL